MDHPARPRRRRTRVSAEPTTRPVDYRHLTSPLPLAKGYSDDRLAKFTRQRSPCSRNWACR